MATPNFASANDGFPSISGAFSGALGGMKDANGRVDLLSPLPQLQIANYQQLSSPSNSSFRREATLGQVSLSDVGSVFFGPENIEALQEGIRYRVYVDTNGKHVIGRQSDSELKIIMRSIYYQYSKNQPTNVLGQVRELNGLVISYAVPEIVNNILQYEKYRRDASMLPMPLERSPIFTNKGSRQLERKIM